MTAIRSKSLLLLLLAIVVAIVCSSSNVAHGAPVASIDLGSEWMKVAVVNLKPGQAPISIAPNEMSKRKSPALVAFLRGDRLVSEQASGILARYPERVFASLRDMVGKPVAAVRELLKMQHLPYDVVETPSGRAAIRVDCCLDENKKHLAYDEVETPSGHAGILVDCCFEENSKPVLYNIEELLAMLLNYACELAEMHTKESIKDAVISVPVFFGQAERQGLLDAAEIAGLNVLSLINEHAGAALQYGIDKDFTDQDRYVVFYDMGASNTYAALVHFTAYTGKSPGGGKNITFQQFHVKGVSWDATLGGQNMEMQLVDHFAAQFKSQTGIDVYKHPKGMAKLKKQVKRTKEILSANTEAGISVESMVEDHDFRGSVTRKKFEELCNDLWERSLNPLKQVLTDAGITQQQLHSVELIGGGTRVPKLKEKLTGYIGEQALARHLDADEAVVLGASLRAANLSDGIKLNRKLGMLDGASYGINIQLDGAILESKDQGLLVPVHKNLPSKMGRTIKSQTKDFKVTLSYDQSAPLPPSITLPHIAAYDIKGVAETVEKYKNHNQSAPMKTTLHFALDRSGVVNLERAEQVVEVSEWVEVVDPIRNITALLANLTANATTGDVNATTVTEESESKPETDAGNLTDENGTATEVTPPPVTVTKKLRKRIFRIPLKITDLTSGPARPLSSKDISEAIKRLEKLNIADAKKRATEAAKNNLEAYIYATKDKLTTMEGVEKEASESERDSFMEKLAEAEDWIYMDGEEAEAKEFQSRLESLLVSWKSIFVRDEPQKEETLLEKEVQPELEISTGDKVEQTFEQATHPKPDISTPSHDEL